MRGWAFGNKQWYADPLHASTLGDTIPDGMKCTPTVCSDSDNDGTPDLFDRDIDADNVPNDLDQSPFRKEQRTFSAAAPMMLGIDNYKEGSPLYVDFQVRPTNPDHLGYAFNVLDWPDGDRTGQVQRDENSTRKTFFDVCLQKRQKRLHHVA